MQLVVAAASLVGDLLKARFVFVKLGSKVVPQKKNCSTVKKRRVKQTLKWGGNWLGNRDYENPAQCKT